MNGYETMKTGEIYKEGLNLYMLCNKIIDQGIYGRRTQTDTSVVYQSLAEIHARKSQPSKLCGFAFGRIQAGK